MSEQPGKIRITTEDLEQVYTEAPISTRANSGSPAAAKTTPEGGRSYGNIRDTASAELSAEGEKGSFFLKSWFYLGVSGMLGAVIGWGAIEPFFTDGTEKQIGNFLLIPVVTALICLGCAIAESVVERSVKKALIRAALALGLGIPLGFVFDIIAELAYFVLMVIAVNGGQPDPSSPAVWAARALAWALFGVSAGVIYGAVGMSGKKLLYGVLGGVLGSGLGGALFDPIGLAMKTGDLSRGVGFALFGLFTGVAIGLVESALKDRWLYVSAGPLAGKQFILYKPVTTMGRNQGCDIYLFKDLSIQEVHVTLQSRGPRIWLNAQGPVYVSGQPVKQKMLENRDLIQVGRYMFLYQERQRQ